MVSSKIFLPIRGVQALFAIIVIAISGYLIGTLHHLSFENSRSNFNLFTGLWTIVMMLYWIVVPLVVKNEANVARNPIISTVLDGLTWIFWLGSFACIAAVINGDHHKSLLGALVAFGVLEWLLFSATLALAVMALLGGRGKA